MPLFKTIHFNPSTQILIWKITETFEDLFSQVVLNDSNHNRLNGMKSEMHQRAFLSVRKLLQHAGYTDHDLYYDGFGKPHLHDGKHLSITHSHDFSAIILSTQTVGIDIELQREKIIRIANKFVDSEFSYLDSEKNFEFIRKLTVIWGAKEAIFKIRNEQGISFKDHIKVEAFKMVDMQAISKLHFNNLIKEFAVFFEEIESGESQEANQKFTLVYAFEN